MDEVHLKTIMCFVKINVDIDRIREGIGVDRGALIKVWLHERVKQEKAANAQRVESILPAGLGH